MRGRRSGTAALMALGAVVAAACQPVVTPTPTPPQVTSCGETITAPDGKTQYFAIVDDGIGAPEAVTFDAATQAEKQADVAQIEAADGPVIAVEVDRIVRAAVNPNPADDPQYVNQWGVDAAGFPTAWDGSHAGSQGANTGVPVRVAVLDTGVYRAHEDLGTSAVVPGIDEVGTGDATSDPNGHGTHVAGILGARDNIVGGVGGAPDIEIFPIRVLNAQGSGSYAGVINGINDAVNIAHAKVISMSLGGGGFSQGLQDAVNAAVAAGIVVFAAAGNDGTCAANYPAALTGVLSVAATVQPGTSLASYSQRGLSVDVAAPGSAIRSTLNTGGYGDKSGTSMATPFAAAAAALLIAKCPGITPAQIETRLESTATPIAGNPIQSTSGALRIDLATAGPC